MKRICTLLCATTILSLACSASILDMGTPSKLCSLGARIGVNTSNRTVDKNIFDEWSNNSWGTGINVGVVADVNLRNFISLQPGFYFESRSGNYAYANSSMTAGAPDEILSQFGHTRSYNFTIPVLVAVHFSIAPAVRWNVEVGPYIQLILKNSMGDGFKYPDADSTAWTTYSVAKPSNFDFGFKFGTSLTLCSHFNVGVHYSAGWLDAWKNGLGGRNKAWIFSAGYDF
ncbi:MAG: PorT family protein [Muribaculaceae bacterium]|nr:PorT family protein [Muribaculaceae bacterium]